MSASWGIKNKIVKKQEIFSFVTIVLYTDVLHLDFESYSALFVKINLICHRPRLSTITISLQHHHFTHLFLEARTAQYADAKITFLISTTSFLHIMIKQILSSFSTLSCTGLYVAQNKSLLFLTTEQYHKKPKSTSTVLVQGIAASGSKVVHNGKIIVTPQATRTTAKQTSKHITLSQDAFVYAKPVLDVANNAVNCSHGSAIGIVSDLMLFYLQSRGLSKKDATFLLLETMVSSSTVHSTMLSLMLKKVISKEVS